LISIILKFLKRGDPRTMGWKSKGSASQAPLLLLTLLESQRRTHRERSLNPSYSIRISRKARPGSRRGAKRIVLPSLIARGQSTLFRLRNKRSEKPDFFRLPKVSGPTRHNPLHRELKSEPRHRIIRLDGGGEERAYSQTQEQGHGPPSTKRSCSSLGIWAGGWVRNKKKTRRLLDRLEPATFQL